MTDEDRERFEPETSPDDAGDPAAAFEALRRTVETQGKQLNAEMTIIRKGVELALEQTEKFRQRLRVIGVDRERPFSVLRLAELPDDRRTKGWKQLLGDVFLDVADQVLDELS